MSFVGDIFDIVSGIKHANKQDKLADHADYRANTLFQEQQGFEKMLEALMSDPSSVTKLPGYQFNLDQGTQAVARRMAASGFSGSGNEAIALTQYGQNYAKGMFYDQAKLLAQLSGISQDPNESSKTAVVANESADKMWTGVSNAIGQLFGSFGSGSGGGGTNAAGGILA